jgi:hypothetical protein
MEAPLQAEGPQRALLRSQKTDEGAAEKATDDTGLDTGAGDKTDNSADEA